MQTGRQIPSLSLLWTQSLFPVLSVPLKVQLPALFGGREGWESQGSFSPYLTSWLAEQSFPLLGAPLWSEKQFKGFCLQVPLDTPGVAAPGWRSASTPSGGARSLGVCCTTSGVTREALFPFTIPSLASSGSFHSLDCLTYFSSF